MENLIEVDNIIYTGCPVNITVIIITIISIIIIIMKENFIINIKIYNHSIF